MPDWKRVGKLRAQGASWPEIARDEKVGFHPPHGTDPGRALKALYLRRRLEGGSPSRSGGGEPRPERLSGRSRLRWGIGGAAVAIFALLIVTLVILHPPPGAPTPSSYRGPAAAGTMAQFNYLSQQHTDACHWPGVNLGDETALVNWINGLPDNTYLQGACCTPMDYSPDYSAQVSGLVSYSSISLIATDPYNMPAHTAKADAANAEIALTPSQQSVLNTAAGMTNDHGWCCCECWAYYAHEGLAKALITQYSYDAPQVAAVINLEDCCGGPGSMSM